jgi:hypothetical protein
VLPIENMVMTQLKTSRNGAQDAEGMTRNEIMVHDMLLYKNIVLV